MAGPEVRAAPRRPRKDYRLTRILLSPTRAPGCVCEHRARPFLPVAAGPVQPAPAALGNGPPARTRTRSQSNDAARVLPLGGGAYTKQRSEGFRGLKVDFHAHTKYSRDSTLRPSELIERARAAGLDRIAVTDHNRMDGAWAAHALDPSLIILGEEVDCAEGEDLIGLFIHEPIPAGLPVEEVAARIRDQGGIVYAPHPFAYVRRPAARAARVLAVADVVEAFNGRAFLPVWNRRALRAAVAAGLPAGAGSDGHFAHEIGGVWTELPDFSTAAELRTALPHARPCHARMSSPFIHVASISVELSRKAASLLPRIGSGSGRVVEGSPT
jgi:predicted metal-dependent phosphoesterase TrpH